VGTSTAYHLTHLGWTDVILLEQGQLSCGTTWHAAGLLGQLRATEGGTRLVQYSAELYSRLEQETGLATGFKRCGGVTVARTEDRMVQLRRTAATAEVYDLECELITPARANELYPPLAAEDLVGAIWLPGDGTANPVDVTASLARGARSRGARIFEHTRVIGIEHVHGRVTGVVTEQGPIEAEVVVNCAGQWAKAVGGLAGVNVPLHSAEHFYVVSERIEGVHPDLPILRDPDGYTYFKEEVGGLVIGGFEPRPSRGWPRTDCPIRSSSSSWRRTGTTSPSSWRVRCSASRPSTTPESGSSTTGRRASRPTTSSSWVRRRICGASLWGPASTPWASPRPEERAVPWPSGLWRATPRPTWPLWTSDGSLHSTGTSSGSATGSARSSGCTTRSHGPTASWSRPAPFAAHPSTRSWRRPELCSGPRWAGNGPTSSPRPVRNPASGTRGTSPTGWRGRWTSSVGPAPASPCSTRPRSASS